MIDLAVNKEKEKILRAINGQRYRKKKWLTVCNRAFGVTAVMFFAITAGPAMMLGVDFPSKYPIGFTVLVCFSMVSLALVMWKFDSENRSSDLELSILEDEVVECEDMAQYYDCLEKYGVDSMRLSVVPDALRMEFRLIVSFVEDEEPELSRGMGVLNACMCVSTTLYLLCR